MNALTEQLDNGFLSNFLEGAKDISQNKNVFYTDPFEIYTGDYEGRRLDPSRKYEIDLNKDYGPLAGLYKTTNNPSNSTVFAYPMDLATSADGDTTHFMQFNMYETQSAKLRSADRLQALVDEQPLNADNSWMEQVTSKDDDALMKLGLTPLGAGRGTRIGEGRRSNGRSATEQINQRIVDLGADSRGSENTRFRTPNPTRTVRQKKYKSKDTCFLYMPHKINNLAIQSYDSPSLLFASIMGQSITSLVGGLNALGDGDFEQARKEGTKMLQSVGPIAMRKALGALDSVTSMLGMDTELEATATQLLGKAINPRKELVYNSPELRTFEFSYEFYPRNLKESQMVEAMIKMFRFHAAPALATGGNFLVPPSIFAIKFYKRNMNSVEENPFLLKMRDCALTEVNIDYTPNGNFSAFGSGAPVAITMSLTFKELDINVKDDVLEGY